MFLLGHRFFSAVLPLSTNASNREAHEAHEGFGFYIFYVVLFASFVVIPLVSLRPARAAYRNTPYNYNLFFASFALFAVKFFLPS